jgi:hypothetical protein
MTWNVAPVGPHRLRSKIRLPKRVSASKRRGEVARLYAAIECADKRANKRPRKDAGSKRG